MLYSSSYYYYYYYYYYKSTDYSDTSLIYRGTSHIRFKKKTVDSNQKSCVPSMMEMRS